MKRTYILLFLAFNHEKSAFFGGYHCEIFSNLVGNCKRGIISC